MKLGNYKDNDVELCRTTNSRVSTHTAEALLEQHIPFSNVACLNRRITWLCAFFKHLACSCQYAGTKYISGFVESAAHINGHSTPGQDRYSDVSSASEIAVGHC